MPHDPTLAAAPGSGAMFDAIAGRYDLLNRLISFGVDQRWRRATVQALQVPQGGRILDLATGTADLALMAAHMMPSVQIVGLDPSPRMLEIGHQKVARASFTNRIKLMLGDAQALPFEDQYFDGVMMSFGIRNVPDRGRALREIARVTRPGGRIAILELSEPSSGGVRAAMARFHIHTLVPFLGGLLSGRREYHYLEQSIAGFPSVAEFTQLLSRSGLNPVETRPLTFSVCHLYVAVPNIN